MWAVVPWQMWTLTGMLRLTYLRASGNDIVELTPLRGMQRLLRLSLQSNEIEEVSILLERRELKLLQLGNNPLSDEAREVHIPALRERGESVPC